MKMTRLHYTGDLMYHIKCSVLLFLLLSVQRSCSLHLASVTSSSSSSSSSPLASVLSDKISSKNDQVHLLESIASPVPSPAVPLEWSPLIAPENPSIYSSHATHSVSSRALLTPGHKKSLPSGESLKKLLIPNVKPISSLGSFRSDIVSLPRIGDVRYPVFKLSSNGKEEILRKGSHLVPPRVRVFARLLRNILHADDTHPKANKVVRFVSDVSGEIIGLVVNQRFRALGELAGHFVRDGVRHALASSLSHVINH